MSGKEKLNSERNNSILRRTVIPYSHPQSLKIAREDFLFHLLYFKRPLADAINKSASTNRVSTVP